MSSRKVRGVPQPYDVSGRANKWVVTGKKSRYVPIEDWRSIDTVGSLEYETLKGIFGMTHHVDAKYFDLSNDSKAAASLKAKAAMAKGLTDDATGLMTLEQFWRKHFGAQV